MGFREFSVRGLGLQGSGITTWLLRLRAGGGGPGVWFQGRTSDSGEGLRFGTQESGIRV